MRNANTYHIVEIDAGDKEMILSRGLSRSEAIASLGRLRDEYGKHGLAQHDRRINREYKQSLRRVQDVMRQEARSRGVTAL